MNLFLAALAFLAICLPTFAKADDPATGDKLAWQDGPTSGAIGDVATINVPKGYEFLDATDTKKFLEMHHDIAGSNEYLLTPRNFSWFALFHFEPVGYVKDNETLDPTSLLKTVKNENAQGNEERKQRGWPTLSILGWWFKPQYDHNAKLLEWAFRVKNDANNVEVVNYFTRVLGRRGVMDVNLVSLPGNIASSEASLKTILTGFSYDPGQRYSEFKQGDKVAKFGLAALIAGGAAAVATKKGFWAVLAGSVAAAWKALLAAAAGVSAWFRARFRKKQQ